MNNSVIDEHYKKVIETAKGSSESVAAIARKSGVGQAWLDRLLKGNYSSPGIDKIILLENYLIPKNHQLELDVDHNESDAA